MIRDLHASAGGPLYLQLDQRAPHLSTGAHARTLQRHTPQPDPRDLGRFAHQPLPRPPSFNEADVSDKPSFIRGSPQLEGRVIASHALTYQCALASLREVDRGTAAISKHPQAAPASSSRTVIMFTSDNGFYFGEHRLVTGKAPPYEESIRVPLLIRIPTAYRNGAARIPRSPSRWRTSTWRRRSCGWRALSRVALERHCRTMDGRSLPPAAQAATPAGGPPIEGSCWSSTSRGRGTRESAPIRGCASATGSTPSTACRRSGLRRLRARRRARALRARRATRTSSTTWPISRRTPTSSSSLSDRLDQLRDCAGIAGRDQRVERTAVLRVMRRLTTSRRVALAGRTRVGRLDAAGGRRAGTGARIPRAATQPARAQPPRGRPNIVLIQSDDQTIVSSRTG